MSDQTQVPTTPKNPKPRREKSSLEIIKEIDDLSLLIVDLNELSFLRNRLDQRINKLASVGGSDKAGSQE